MLRTLDFESKEKYKSKNVKLDPRTLPQIVDFIRFIHMNPDFSYFTRPFSIGYVLASYGFGLIESSIIIDRANTKRSPHKHTT